MTASLHQDWRQQPIRPERIMASGFLALILLGGLLLSLPIASATGKSIGLFNSFFTATSAVCVTGLVTVDTGTTLSLFGQIVLLLLIQTGGLGFMIFATLVMVLLGRRISLKNRVMIRESMSAATLSGLIRLSLWYGGMALCIELAGAALLSLRFVPLYGWGKGLYYSLFHAVSAFCNAGFDLFGHFSSLTGFIHDPLVVLTVSMLILLGGLGFSVMFECIHCHHDFRRLSLHAKLVLTVSLGLLVVGTLGFLLLERSNPATLGAEGMSFGDKLLNAFFQSVTLRTAGFNTIDLGAMRESSKLWSVILMFIGASPASTGGGIKTTTFFVVMLSVIATVRQRQDYNYHHRRLAEGLVKRALALATLALSLVIMDTVVISAIEYWSGGQENMVDILFEVVSAFGTVGLSTGITAGLHDVAKFMLIITMFCGRVGLLTVSMALSGGGNKASAVRYPEDRMMVG